VSKYTEFFLKSSSKVVQLELLEMSHPAWSKVYRIVRNSVSGIVVKLENGETASFDYYPVNIKYDGMRDDLEQSYSIQFGDLGEIMPLELDRMLNSDTMSVKPKLIYRVYRSDVLDSPLYDPQYLEIQNFAFNRDGVSFQAIAPQLNVTQTGSEYTTDRFPTLQGYL